MQKDDFLQLLSALNIDDKQIEKIALNTGFLIRKRLVIPADMLYAICCQSIQGTVSFNDVAAKIDSESAVSVSRQAIEKKMSKTSCMDFLQKILALVILSKIDKNEIDSLRQGNKFIRVLVQDSTLDLRQGDLVIRDRGYLTSSEIHRHLQLKADCIYRHKSATIYLNNQTGEEIQRTI